MIIKEEQKEILAKNKFKLYARKSGGQKEEKLKKQWTQHKMSTK